MVGKIKLQSTELAHERGEFGKEYAMPMRKISWLLCVVVALLLGPARMVEYAVAQQDPRGPVRMAFVEFPPYSYTNDHGQAAGYSIDLARELLGAAGRDMRFVLADDPTQMIQMLGRGDADVSSVLALSPDRLEVADATDQLGNFDSRLFARIGEKTPQVEDFHGARIGVVSGSIAVQVGQQIPFAKLVEYDDQDAQIMGLLRGDVDAAVGASDSFGARLRLMGIDRMIEAVKPALVEMPYGIFVSPNRPDLLTQMNGAIQTNLTRADLSNLHDRWFGAPTRLPGDDIIKWGAALTALLLGVIAIIFMRARLQARMLRAVSEKAASSALFVDAMNAVSAAIVIYNKDLEAIHWNEGFAQTFPKLMPQIKQGTTLHGLICNSYETGTIIGTARDHETHKIADKVVKQLKAGQTVTRIVRASNGRVFEAAEVPLGEGYYASLRVDVTRLHAQAKLIETQKSELEAANSKLEVFATIAAHDLKSPLVQQAALLQAIEEDLDDVGQALPDGVQSYFGMLTLLSDRMKHLINGLLEHARADDASGAVEEIDVNARMPAILEMVDIPDTFQIDIQPDLPNLKGATASFDAVMRNLISNAVKHHDLNGGHIQVRGHKIGDQLVYEVEDDGPGIPDQYLASIFDPFSRLSANVEGSGLGLSFIKKTVNQWGGGIYAECRKERGSVFVFSVPADQDVIIGLEPKAVPDHVQMH